jgi:hypothetical protein
VPARNRLARGKTLAALIATQPGCRARLIYRICTGRRHDQRKGFTETDWLFRPGV